MMVRDASLVLTASLRDMFTVMSFALSNKGPLLWTQGRLYVFAGSWVFVAKNGLPRGDFGAQAIQDALIKYLEKK